MRQSFCFNIFNYQFNREIKFLMKVFSKQQSKWNEYSRSFIDPIVFKDKAILLDKSRISDYVWYSFRHLPMFELQPQIQWECLDVCYTMKFYWYSHTEAKKFNSLPESGEYEDHFWPYQTIWIQIRPRKMWGPIWDLNCLTIRLYIGKAWDGNFFCLLQILKEFHFYIVCKE